MAQSAANKLVILPPVAAEQSVRYRSPTDEGSRELPSRTLRLRPGVHLWSTSRQSDRSL